MSPNRFSRRYLVRAVAFACVAVLLAFSTPVALARERQNTARTRQIYAAALLTRMAEEAYAVNRTLSDELPDPAAIRESCSFIGGMASLAAACDPGVRQTASDAAAVFTVIGAHAAVFAATGDNTAVIYRRCADRTAGLLCEAALALGSCHPTDIGGALSFARDALSDLAASFAPDAVRSSDTQAATDTPTALAARYRGEVTVSSADAKDALNALPGGGGRFFSYAETADDCYRFSCKNGYALYSVHGGHLLSYLLIPRDAHSDHDCVSRALSAGDLEEAADTFCASAGVPGTAVGADYTDRHGIRHFTTENARIGVRLCDGHVLSFSLLPVDTEA